MFNTFAIGNLTRDPESRAYEKNGKSGTVCSFSIAVNGVRRDDPATFIRVSVFGNMAEPCAKYLAKGRKVAVTGRVSASAYLNKEGKPVASLEMLADSVEFLSSASSGNSEGSPAAAPRPTNYDKATGYTVEDSNNIPF